DGVKRTAQADAIVSPNKCPQVLVKQTEVSVDPAISFSAGINADADPRRDSALVTDFALVIPTYAIIHYHTRDYFPTVLYVSCDIVVAPMPRWIRPERNTLRQCTADRPAISVTRAVDICPTGTPEVRIIHAHFDVVRSDVGAQFFGIP